MRNAAGLSDITACPIGFGSAAIGGYDYGSVDDSASIAAVQRALHRGVTFFDTADVYGFGHAETILFQALGERRHELIIATKGGVRWDDSGRTQRDLRPAYLERALEASLRRLQIDCIPLYQVHWPDPETPVEDTVAALARFQEQGKIRWIGCCNVDVNWIARAAAIAPIETLQVPYSVIQREWTETVMQCRDRFATRIIAYSVLAQGLLTGKYNPQSRFQGSDLRQRSELFQGERHHKGLLAVRALNEIAERHGCTAAQVAIRWTIDQPMVDIALAGMKTVEHADDNLEALRCVLTYQDIQKLNTL